MDKVARMASSVPLIKAAASRTGIAPEYIAIAAVLSGFLIIQRTPLGGPFAAALSAAIVLRDSLVVLRAPAPTLAAMRRQLVVLSLYVLFSVLESTGLSGLIPLFGILKIVLLVWAASSDANSDMVYNLTFARVPDEYLATGGHIQAAMKTAAKDAVTKAESAAKAEPGAKVPPAARETKKTE